MGTSADKLNKLIQTKADIKNAIIEKGGVVNDSTPFGDYAQAIRDISGGGGSSSAAINRIGSAFYEAATDEDSEGFTFDRGGFIILNNSVINLGNELVLHFKCTDISQGKGYLFCFENNTDGAVFFYRNAFYMGDNRDNAIRATKLFDYDGTQGYDVYIKLSDMIGLNGSFNATYSHSFDGITYTEDTIFRLLEGIRGYSRTTTLGTRVDGNTGDDNLAGFKLIKKGSIVKLKSVSSATSWEWGFGDRDITIVFDTAIETDFSEMSWGNIIW